MNIYEIYKEELAAKNTVSSKKAFLTKSAKEVELHLKELKEAMKKTAGGNMKYAYLHGDPVTNLRISKVKTELKVIHNIQKSLGVIDKNQGLKQPEIMKSVKVLEARLLFETKQSNRYRMRRNQAVTSKQKEEWKALIDLAEKSKLELKKQLETMKKAGLKKPTVRGLKKVCSHVVKATGLKVDGTLKKGFKYIKGGKIVAVAKEKKPVVKKKTVAKKKVAKKN